MFRTTTRRVSKLWLGIAAAAAALLLMFVAAGPASADFYGGGTTRNGNVYLVTNSGGCHFSGTVNSLGACSNNFYEVDNDGYNSVGFVNLFYEPNLQGAYACIAPGSFWVQSGHWAGSNGPPVTFSRGTGAAHQAGKGQSIWNNAASLQWVSRCSG